MAVTRAEVDEVLATTYDPDLDIDLKTLGLIHGIAFDEIAQELEVTMTFTTPLCPHGGEMIEEIKRRFRELGLEKVRVVVTFDPPWMPPEGIREMLGV